MIGGAFGGKGRFGNRSEGPVLLVLGSLGNPCLDDLFLLGREGLARLGRGHDFLLVLAVQSKDEFALAWFSRDDGGVVTEILECSFLSIQPEVCFPGFLVRSMAVKAVLGEEWTDVLREVDGRLCG